MLKYVSQRYAMSQSSVLVEILDGWTFSGLSTTEAKYVYLPFHQACCAAGKVREETTSCEKQELF